MAADFIDLLARTTLASSGAILLVLVLRRPVRLAWGARVAYALWTAPLAAIAAVLLPARRLVMEAAPVAFEPLEAVSVTASTGRSGPDPALVLTAAWALGALLVLSLILWRQRRFLSSLGGLTRAAQPDLFLAARPGVGPALLGALRPKVVLPADFAERFSTEEQAVMIGHERAHLSAGDTRINTLVALAQCLYWFNPLVHIAAFYLRLDQELACDAAVVARFPQHRRCYAETMLKAQLAPIHLPLGCYWLARGVEPLRVRIAMLKRRPPNVAVTRLGLGATLLLSLGAGAAAWAAKPPIQVPAVALFTASSRELPARRAAASQPKPKTAPIETVLRSVERGGRDSTDGFREQPAGAEAQRILPSPKGVTRPDWEEIPTAADIMQSYPERALRLEQEGAVRLSCQVRANGTLELCRVESETPTGLGFGDAAMGLVPTFRMRPASKDGQPVSGAHVNIPIQFRLGDPPKAGPWEEQPRVMNNEGLSGTVRLRCRVTPEGKLEECSVAKDTPGGGGLGDAALKLAPQMTLRATTPIPDDRIVDVPILFKNE